MNQKIKKLLIYSSIALVLFFLLATIYLFFPKKLESLDNRLRDFIFMTQNTQEPSKNIIIIDIDDKSLEKIGQWPWSRDVMSKLLKKLTKNGVGIIGFDIVFAEKDRTNPKTILEKLDIKTTKKIPNYDQLFAQTIANSPTILGYQFQLEKGDFIQQKAPSIPAIFIEKNKQLQQKDKVQNAYGTILNTPLIQNSGYSSGFFNNIPDESGIVRSVPLIIRYKDQLYPSLALEIIRVIANTNKIFVYYDINGVTHLRINQFIIPTDRYGKLVVNYRGKSKTFQYISAFDILNGNFKQKDISGKIALIGTSAAGLLDLRSTPLESVYPGVEIHANVIDNILTQDYLIKPSWIDGLNLLHILIITFLTIFLIAYTTPLNSLIAIFLLFGIDISLIYYLLVTKGLIANILFPLLSFTFATISAFIFNYFLETKYNTSIKNKFASKVSQEVMDSLLEDPNNDNFRAMEKEITIFFSDVRNFTNISEAIGNPKILIEFLNSYITPMTEIIIKYQGTIDKFIGDAIMAYWNAPNNIPNHPKLALTAALEQLHSLKTINQKIKQNPQFKKVVHMALSNNTEPLKIGIGINTGEAIVGEMGSKKRSDYTVIGDTINLGSRLESLCKYYDSSCNISGYTKNKLNENDFIFRFLDLVTVKGKEKPVEIWQVIDYNRDESFPKLYSCSKQTLLKELNLYHQAISLYQQTQFKKALKLFLELENNKHKTNEKIYKIYIKRSKHYIQNPPKNFTGVFQHTTKK